MPFSMKDYKEFCDFIALKEASCNVLGVII